MGLIYSKGDGVPQNEETANKWYELASENGNARAQFNLGNSYFKGRGTEKSFILAHKWWNIAAAQGVNEAKANLGLLEERMSSEEIDMAQRLAQEWAEKFNERNRRN